MTTTLDRTIWITFHSLSWLNPKKWNAEIDNQQPIEIAYLNSPVGWLKISGNGSFLYRIEYEDDYSAQKEIIPTELSRICTQLDEYFKGFRKEFDLNLKPHGTDFQLRVWDEVTKIQYGKVNTYLDLAIQLGDKGSLRAVGGANGSNPIPIVIPCHRVIGAGGKLVGYTGGLWRKEWLLKNEGFKFSADPDQLDLF